MAPDSRGWGYSYSADSHTLTYKPAPVSTLTDFTYNDTFGTAGNTTRIDYGYYTNSTWTYADNAEDSRRIKAARKRWLVFTRGNGWVEPERRHLAPVVRPAARLSIKPLRRESPRRSRPPRARSFKQVRNSLRKQLRD